MIADWGILLAAGSGARLGSFNQGKAKALLPVLGRPLLAYALAGLQAVSRAQLVVGGCDAAEVLAAARALVPDVRCVTNPDFRGQNLQSLAVALAELESGSIHVCNVDHIKSVGMVKRIRAEGEAAYGCVTPEWDDPDVMKVALDASGCVLAMAKTLERYDGIYAGDFGCARLADFKNAVARALHEVGAPRAVTEDAIVALGGVRLADLGPDRWLEVDNPAECAQAEEELRRWGTAYVCPLG